MKKSTKAALYSAFIFPGAGLYWRKQYTRGSLFFIPALVAIVYIMNGLFLVSSELNVKIKSNPEAYMDFTLLINAVSSSIANNIPHLHHAKWIFIACWLLSILSSYFVGLAHEKQELQ